MYFEWDEVKNAINIQKHGIDFNDVKDLFNHPMLTLLDTREDYGEDRWIGVGWIQQLIGVVVYVERHEDTIRIISARKATKNEVRRYEQSVKN
ncbi:BrnT family toxin [Marinagarivorans algicola]|uniref:BrnT family toxin n=1 Tax=Marinagarivorans algicola TaxID=1513270 RepID=UPI0006B656BF|nr:BrnT family toxin [Marinagarivorans algicola]